MGKIICLLNYPKLPKTTALIEFYGQDNLPLELLKSTALNEFYGQDNLPLELPKRLSLDEPYGKLPKSTILD